MRALSAAAPSFLPLALCCCWAHHRENYMKLFSCFCIDIFLFLARNWAQAVARGSGWRELCCCQGCAPSYRRGCGGAWGGQDEQGLLLVRISSSPFPPEDRTHRKHCHWYIYWLTYFEDYSGMVMALLETAMTESQPCGICVELLEMH